MSELNASNLRKEHGNEGPDLVGVTELTSPYYMVPPSGTTAERPQNPSPGTLRFNTDIGSLEYFKGDTLGWESIDRTTPNLGGGTGSNTGLGVRGFIGGGNGPTPAANTMNNTIDFITISTFGNAQDFGDLTRASTGASGSSSRTRGLFTNRRVFPNPGGYYNEMDYITLASLGNAQDFGDAVNTNGYGRAFSNQIRSVNALLSSYNYMDYVTIATTGNGVDFGDMTEVHEAGAALASTTRGVMAGGQSKNVIDYVTIMTTGNALDFGDMSTTTSTSQGMANATRGVIKWRDTPAYTNAIDYLTIATKGNSTDFGDFINNSASGVGCASPTRGCFCGGYGSPAFRSDIGSIEIPTTGNALDFGDLTYTADWAAGSSSGHGGL